MFAVIRTGGKQYRVEQNTKLLIEKIEGNAGDKIEIADVLIAGDGSNVKVGKDAASIKVSAEIIEQTKGDKVLIFKKKRRHNYRRKNGHRQQLTAIKITDLGLGGSAKKSKKSEEAASAE